MSSRILLLILIGTMPLLSGCIALSPRRVAPQPPRFAAAPATVFVTDGAGNFQYASQFLRKVVEGDGYPIEVITFEWSHGNRRIVRDQLDFAHAQCEGRKLAATVQAYQTANPDRLIYLVAHSAGTTSALVALEHLPPTVVERAVLLAPSLSKYYDTRPALRGVKHDIHVFHSYRDLLVLGIVTHRIGTSDGRRTATAGRVGFIPYADPDEPELLNKLVHHRWQRSDRALGHNGGHFGYYQPDFLREYIIPLLNPTGPSGAPAAPTAALPAEPLQNLELTRRIRTREAEPPAELQRTNFREITSRPEPRPSFPVDPSDR